MFKFYLLLILVINKPSHSLLLFLPLSHIQIKKLLFCVEVNLNIIFYIKMI